MDHRSSSQSFTKEMVPAHIVVHGVLTQRGIVRAFPGIRARMPNASQQLWLPLNRLMEMPMICTIEKPGVITAGDYGGVPSELVIAEVEFLPRFAMHYALLCKPAQSASELALGVQKAWRAALLRYWAPYIMLQSIRYVFTQGWFDGYKRSLRLFGIDYRLRRRLQRSKINDVRDLAMWLESGVNSGKPIALADGTKLTLQEQAKLVTHLCAFLAWQMLA